ncbi:MAG: DUF4236 domain-containing protein [Firmicutes bacterium]|nr:DUF4236 domain-containing protein [Bacillota bacterium]
MALRFRRSIRIAKGVRINLSKGGIGVSAGVPGARVGTGPRGAYTSAGIPGSGIYAINYHGKGKRTVAGQTQTRQVRQQTGQPYQSAFALSPPKGLNWYVGPLGIGILTFVLLVSLNWMSLIGIPATILWFRSARNSASARARRHWLQAVSLEKQGEFDSALEQLQMVAELLPQADLTAPMAKIALEAQNTDLALDLFDQWLPAAKPKQLVEAALLLMEAEQWEKAVTVFQRLPDDIRQNIIVINLQAHCLLEAGKPKIALELLRTGPTRRRKMDPDLVEFRYLLGKAMILSGQKARGKDQLRRVLAVDMDYKDAAELLAAAE